MATGSALYVTSYHRSSCVSESKPSWNINSTCLRSNTSIYRGLRYLNNIDMLRVRTSSNSKPRPSRFSYQTANIRFPMAAIAARRMEIVFVGAEVSPWSKTGGLGDVLGGLPSALASDGHKVMTVAPRYDQYNDAWDTSVVIEIQVDNEIHNVRFFHCYKGGVDHVFVDHPMFLEKVWGVTGPKLYGPVPGEDYPDNNRRFSLLCEAALKAPRVLNLHSGDCYSGTYGEDVVFVCNDWHTSLLPCYLKSRYKLNGMYRNAKSVLCIHNISYQGRFPASEYSSLDLPDTFKSSFEFVGNYNDPDSGRKINWLKAGILEADRVLTVSPNHAQELVTNEFKGMEMANILCKAGITGILNGLDVLEWNPSTDKYIPVKYNTNTVMHAKPIAKEGLQAEVGLPVDRNVPLVAFVGRLEEQKGPDILAASVPKFIGENVQFVALGTGKKIFEKQLEELDRTYPNKARCLTKYNPKLSHMILAGADFVLIPSRFEPCGLIQMQAMKYGTVPIVASTGGLVDTVKEGYTGFHMGPFNVDADKVDPRDVTAISLTVRRAIGIYGSPAFSQMVHNCMAQDFSWKEPAKNWERMLQSLHVYGMEAGVYGEGFAVPAARANLVAA